MVCGSACLNLSAQSARLALPYVAGSWLQLWLKDNAYTPTMHHHRHNPPSLSRSSHILVVLNREDQKGEELMVPIFLSPPRVVYPLY
ncbi:unnamed protein product [Sphagnum balticum]